MGLQGARIGRTRVQLIQNNNTVVQVDASVKEDHSREAEPTQFPVENGNTISDHVIVKPFALTITASITDTPIGDITGLLTEAATSVTAALIPPPAVIAAVGAAALFSALASSSKPSVAAYGQLLQLQANAQPVDVITSLYRYESMWISSISVPREASNGNELFFTIKLVQLLLVQPQSVNIQIFANPGLAANEADKGQKGLLLNGKFAEGRAAGISDTNSLINSATGGSIIH